jgi:hypothetical protein
MTQWLRPLNAGVLRNKQINQTVSPVVNPWIKFRSITCRGSRFRCQTLATQGLSVRRNGVSLQ